MARATHSQEFKDKAVMMYMDGKSSYAVAKEMGILPEAARTQPIEEDEPENYFGRNGEYPF